MKRKEIVITQSKLAEEHPVITVADFNEFMQAKTYEERIGILLAHSQKNNKAIRQRCSQMEIRKNK